MDQGDSCVLIIALDLLDSLITCGLFSGNTECVPPDSLALKLICNPLEKGVQVFVDFSLSPGPSSSSI